MENNLTLFCETPYPATQQFYSHVYSRESPTFLLHMTQMFLAIRVRLVKAWKQPKRPSTRKWIHYGNFHNRILYITENASTTAISNLIKAKQNKQKKKNSRRVQRISFVLKLKKWYTLQNFFFWKQREQKSVSAVTGSGDDKCLRWGGASQWTVVSDSGRVLRSGMGVGSWCSLILICLITWFRNSSKHALLNIHTYIFLFSARYEIH